MNEIVNEGKNFNVVLPMTNPHRFKDFNKKPWCMHLTQVLKKKKKNVSVGQYSKNTISWFLILSEHTKNGVLINPK